MNVASVLFRTLLFLFLLAVVPALVPLHGAGWLLIDTFENGEPQAVWSKSTDMIADYSGGNLYFRNPGVEPQHIYTALPQAVYSGKLTMTFDFWLPPGLLQNEVGFGMASPAQLMRTWWGPVGSRNRFQTVGVYPQNLTKVPEWDLDLLNTTEQATWYNIWVVYDLDAETISFYSRRSDDEDKSAVFRGAFPFWGSLEEHQSSSDDLSLITHFVLGAGSLHPEIEGETALGGVIDNIYMAIGENLTPSPTAIGLEPALPPVILAQPAGALVIEGDSVELVVEADGLDLEYQWYKDDEPVEGMTGPSLTIHAMSAADAGVYFVRISNTNGSVRSDDAVLLFEPSSAGPGSPRIIFISENQSALLAARDVVTREYNLQQLEALRETDFVTWQSYEPVEWRSVPIAWRDARLAEILQILGLAENDPADKGFTDFLESLGYDVYRTGSVRGIDPVTGAAWENHEFWGEIGAPGDEGYGLSGEQIQRLSDADLIIMSPNTSANRYSWSGGVPLIGQWNNLPVPILSMNALLATTNEWGSYAWGWSYGYTFGWDTIAPYDRRDQTPAYLERFVFSNPRPQVRRPDHPLLAGITQVEDARVNLYKEELPVLPRTIRKFSSNANYTFPPNVRVILEFELPSFFAAGLEIETRDPVLMEADSNVRYFTPTGMPSDRVGTPAERRLYLAAGVGATGLYNLSPTGEQVLTNAVVDLAGPVFVAPEILGQPQSVSAEETAAVHFHVSVSGNPEPEIRWQRSIAAEAPFEDIAESFLFSGTNTPVLQIAAVFGMDNHRFRAIATNTVGSVTSDIALLSVTKIKVPPAFLSHPIDSAVTEGSEVHFSVEAVGIPNPVLQWQMSADGGVSFSNIHDSSLGGSVFSGTQSDTLKIHSMIDFLDGVYFRAQASNEAGVAVSNAALLNLGPLAGFAAWLDDVAIPPDARGLADRHGPLGLRNLEAYALGLSPFLATAEDLPHTLSDPTQDGNVRFVYQVNLDAVDVSVGIERAMRLDGLWLPAEPVSESVLWNTNDVEGREATFAIDGEPLFLRLHIQFAD